MFQAIASTRLRFPARSLVALAITLASTTLGAESIRRASPDAPQVAISGRVIDFETKRPIAGAKVIASLRSLDEPEASPSTPSPSDPRVATDEEGRFSVTVQKAADPPRSLGVMLFVRHPKYVSRKSKRFSLPMLAAAHASGAKPFCAEITIRAGIEYSAQVVSPDDEPVARVEFEFWTQSEEHASPSFSDDLRGTSDASGWYRGRMPRSRFIHAVITPERFAPTRHQWDARERERFPTEEVPAQLGRFILDPGVTLSGSVVGLDGQPIAGLTVAAASTSEDISRIAKTDAEGWFRFAPMHPGIYVVGAASQGFQSGGVAQSDPGANRVVRPVLANLGRGWWSFPVKLHELPSVRVCARFVDSTGRPTRGNRVVVGGSIPNPGREHEPPPLDADDEEVLDALLTPNDTDGLAWSGRADPDANGLAMVHVPKGLRQTQISTEDDTGELAYMVRMKPGWELTPSAGGSLGELRRDVNGIEFHAFRSPTLLVEVVDDLGDPVSEEVNISSYLTVNKALLSSGRVTRVDMGRYRFRGMLPDRPYMIYTNANSYLSARVEEISIPEGGTREVSMILTKPPTAAEVGDLAPPILVTTLDGKARSLADYGGRHVLVTIWAIDQSEGTLKKLKEIQERFGKDPKFAMLSLSYEQDREALIEKVKELKLEWPVARLGAAFDELRAAYGWQQYPSSFLVGPDGKIVAKDIEEDGLMGTVAGALKK